MFCTPYPNGEFKFFELFYWVVRFLEKSISAGIRPGLIRWCSPLIKCTFYNIEPKSLSRTLWLFFSASNSPNALKALTAKSCQHFIRKIMKIFKTVEALKVIHGLNMAIKCWSQLQGIKNQIIVRAHVAEAEFTYLGWGLLYQPPGHCTLAVPPSLWAALPLPERAPQGWH